MGLMGEALEEATITTKGVLGDRAYAISDSRTGMLLEPLPKKYGWGDTKGEASMLLLSARYLGDEDGELSIEFPDGYVAVETEDIKEKLSKFFGYEVRLVEVPWLMEEKSRRGRAIHLITTSSIVTLKEYNNASNFRVERFRPNVLVSTDGKWGFVEEGWIDALLKIGEQVILRAEKPNERCGVTSLAQRGIPEDPEVHRTIVKLNSNRLGIMCSVVSEGSVKIGDLVQISVDYLSE